MTPRPLVGRVRPSGAEVATVGTGGGRVNPTKVVRRAWSVALGRRIGLHRAPVSGSLEHESTTRGARRRPLPSRFVSPSSSVLTVVPCGGCVRGRRQPARHRPSPLPGGTSRGKDSVRFRTLTLTIALTVLAAGIVAAPARGGRPLTPQSQAAAASRASSLAQRARERASAAAADLAGARELFAATNAVGRRPDVGRFAGDDAGRHGPDCSPRHCSPTASSPPTRSRRCRRAAPPSPVWRTAGPSRCGGCSSACASSPRSPAGTSVASGSRSSRSPAGSTA